MRGTTFRFAGTTFRIKRNLVPVLSLALMRNRVPVRGAFFAPFFGLVTVAFTIEIERHEPVRQPVFVGAFRPTSAIDFEEPLGLKAVNDVAHASICHGRSGGDVAHPRPALIRTVRPLGNCH
jgi:hypothetical protein